MRSEKGVLQCERVIIGAPIGESPTCSRARDGADNAPPGRDASPGAGGQQLAPRLKCSPRSLIYSPGLRVCFFHERYARPPRHPFPTLGGARAARAEARSAKGVRAREYARRLSPVQACLISLFKQRNPPVRPAQSTRPVFASFLLEITLGFFFRLKPFDDFDLRTTGSSANVFRRSSYSARESCSFSGNAPRVNK